MIEDVLSKVSGVKSGRPGGQPSASSYFKLDTSNFRPSICCRRPIMPNEPNFKQLAGRGNTQRSTALLFHHSNPMPIARNKANSPGGAGLSCTNKPNLACSGARRRVAVNKQSQLAGGAGAGRGPVVQTRRARQKSGSAEPILGIGPETRLESAFAGFCRARQTNPISDGPGGVRRAILRNKANSASRAEGAEGKMRETKPNLGELGYIGNGVEGLVQTNPIWRDARSGLPPRACAGRLYKQTQFWRSLKFEVRSAKQTQLPASGPAGGDYATTPRCPVSFRQQSQSRAASGWGGRSYKQSQFRAPAKPGVDCAKQTQFEAARPVPGVPIVRNKANRRPKCPPFHYSIIPPFQPDAYRARRTPSAEVHHRGTETTEVVLDSWTDRPRFHSPCPLCLGGEQVCKTKPISGGQDSDREVSPLNSRPSSFGPSLGLLYKQSQFPADTE
jgi:hypothetical protein